MGKTLERDRLQGEWIAVAECADGNVPTHGHDFFEFAYVVQGRAEHTINGRTFLLSEGDYFLINRNDTHAYHAITAEGFRIINCMFLPQFIDRSLTDAPGFREILNTYFLPLGDQKVSDRVTLQSYHDQEGFLGMLIMHMLEEYREKKAGHREVLRSLLVTLLIDLARHDTEPDGDGEQITRYIKKYVAEHYPEPISLSDLSRQLNFSLTHVSLTFKKDTQMSFRDYLIKIRMEKACRLLRSSDKTVAQIAEMVGYTDPAFFYKAFRKTLGQTPADYRTREKKS